MTAHLYAYRPAVTAEINDMNYCPFIHNSLKVIVTLNAKKSRTIVIFLLSAAISPGSPGFLSLSNQSVLQELTLP